MPINNAHPQDIEIADRVQLGFIGLGDGFFPLKGNVTINNVTRPMSSWMAEVIPGTGLHVLIRDYVAMIEGVVLTDKSKDDLDFTQTESLTIPSIGTWYITLRANTFTGYDGTDRPDSDKGVFAAESSAPAIDSGKILVATVTVPSLTTQITSGMINNSTKKFLLNLDVADASLSNQITNMVPTNLAATLTSLQNQITALQNQINNPLVATDTITASKLDNSSTVGVNMSGNFTLPSFVPTVYLQDNFPGVSLDSSKWYSYGNPAIQSGVVLRDDSAGVFAIIWGKNQHSSQVQSVTSWTWQGLASPSAQGLGIVRLITNPNSAGGSPEVTCYLNGRFDGSGNLTEFSVVAVSDVLNVLLGSIDIPLSYFSGSNITTGISISNMGIQRNNGLITVSVGGQTIATISDATSLSGSTYSMYFYPADSAKTVLNNVLVESIVLGTYNTSGVLLTTQLNSVSPIKKAAMGWNSSVPVGTSAVFELSLDGGSHWVTVTDDQIIDGTLSPWNGTGSNLKARITLSTTNTSVSPVIGPVNVSTSNV